MHQRAAGAGRGGDRIDAASGSGGREPRLLVLSPDFPPARGGIQALLQGLLGELEGFQIRVVTLAQADAAGFDAAFGLPIRRVRAPQGIGPARNLPLNAAALREGWSFRPELVLSAHIVVGPATAAIGRLLGARTVQYFHANEIVDKPRLSAFSARTSDVSIAVSTYTASLLEAAGVAPQRIRLIPPGVTLPAPLPAEPPGRPTVLTVARMAGSYKGHDVMLRALALVRERVPEVEWVVIGDGPLRDELEQSAASLGVAGCVRFLGATSDEQRDRWLRRADVFAMPSRLPGGRLAGEGFGIVYLEASAYGMPVVAGNAGGAVDAVSDGETGLLVDASDAAAVAEALTRLLLDRELARSMGEAGARRAQDFAWPAIAERVRALLLELLAAGTTAEGGPRGRRPSRSAA